MDKCHSCGREFESIGIHWSKSNCGYPQIGRELNELFIGLLMGDGYVDSCGNGYDLLEVQMVKEEFLEWVDEEAGVLTTGVKMKDNASTLAEKNRDSETVNVVNEEKYNDMFRLRSRSHPYFTELSKWYSSGKKRFPTELDLTPRILKTWYVCDGFLMKREESQRESAFIGVQNEIDRQSYLDGLFEGIGLTPTYTNSNLYFGVDDTEDFFEYIGESLPGFEYKWPN